MNMIRNVRAVPIHRNKTALVMEMSMPKSERCTIACCPDSQAWMISFRNSSPCTCNNASVTKPLLPVPILYACPAAVSASNLYSPEQEQYVLYDVDTCEPADQGKRRPRRQKDGRSDSNHREHEPSEVDHHSAQDPLPRQLAAEQPGREGDGRETHQPDPSPVEKRPSIDGAEVVSNDCRSPKRHHGRSRRP